MNITAIILLLLGLLICYFLGRAYYKGSISKVLAFILLVLIAFFSVRLALKYSQDILREAKPVRSLWTGFILSSIMALLGLLYIKNESGLKGCTCSGACSCGTKKKCCGKAGCNCKNGGICLCNKKNSSSKCADGTCNHPQHQHLKKVKTAAVVSGGVPVYAGKKDDLKVVEGIGPVIEGFLNEHGVTSYAQLGAMQPEAVKEILDRAGDRFRTHTTESRPLQARFAGAGRKKELKEMKDELDGGKFIVGGTYHKDSV